MHRRPYRIKKRKSVLKNRFFWLIVFVLMMTGGIFYLFCFYKFFQIKEIKISGNQKVSVQDLENTIESQIVFRVIFFQTKSIFLADEGKINNVVLENFTQITNVNIKKDFPDALIVEIEERKPVAIFCQTQQDQATSSGQMVLGQYEKNFFIDREGVIFEESLEPDSQRVKIKNQSLSSEIKLGEKAVDEKILSQILDIELKLEKELKVALEEITVVSEQRLNAKTKEGWEIYFNLKGDLSWQITKLGAVLENKIPFQKRKNLKYIDLRFEKIYISPEI